MSGKIRLFIIECVDPMDMIQERSEGKALDQICKIIGHEVAILTAYSRDDLNKYCDYISSIDTNHDNRTRRKAPLCVHIAAHGNRNGVAFGKDFLDWRDLFLSLDPIIKDMNSYNGEVLISISACGAGRQKLVDEIESEIENPRSVRRRRENICPPEFIFVTEGSDGKQVTYWDDSAVSWTIFYHQLSKLRTISQRGVNGIIQDIKNTTGTKLSSFKWDNEKDRYFR